jgi:hypothetical protein
LLVVVVLLLLLCCDDDDGARFCPVHTERVNITRVELCGGCVVVVWWLVMVMEHGAFLPQPAE